MTVSRNHPGLNEVNLEFGVDLPGSGRGRPGMFRNPMYIKIAEELRKSPGETARIGTFDRQRMAALRVAFRNRGQHGIVLSQRRLADGAYEMFGVYDPSLEEA